MAKTQYSLTDDQTKLGAPTDREITVRNLKISAGAGFIVALTGEIMTMPGLPKRPAAERIDVDETGEDFRLVLLNGSDKLWNGGPAAGRLRIRTLCVSGAAGSAPDTL